MGGRMGRDTGSAVIEEARALVRINEVGPDKVHVMQEASKALAGRVEVDEDVHIHKFAYNTRHVGNNWTGNPEQPAHVAAEAEVAQAVARREAADERRAVALAAQVRINRVAESDFESQHRVILEQQ